MYKAKRVAVLVGTLGAIGLGGSAIASATTSTTSTTSTTATTSTTSGPPTSTSGSAGKAPANFPAHGTAAHEDAEKPVTGATATKVQAAAVKIVGSGTAGAVTTDYQGSGYETTVTKSDGTKVEIHLDSSFKEVGPGMGGMSGHAMSGPPMGGTPPTGTPPSGSYSG
jgi:hypothetical protein